MNELIIVKQLPIIEERLKELSNEIDEKVNNATSLVCTADTVKEVKKVRAELNNEFKELESQRKVVKEQVMKPYNEFEDIYKSYVTEKFKVADNALKDKINSVENEIKGKIQKKLETYFNELLVKENIDFVKLSDMNLSITLDLQTEKGELTKKARDKVDEFINKIVNDLKLIDSQEYKDEILYEYKKYLDATIAIVEVKKRHEEMEKAKQVVEEKKDQKITDEEMINKIDSLVAPTVEDDEIYEMTFKVRGTKSQLKEIKEFLVNGGYDYE